MKSSMECKFRMQSERRKKHEKPRRWEMDGVAAATTFACTHQEFLETLATTVTSGTAIDQIQLDSFDCISAIETHRCATLYASNESVIRS